MLDFAGESGARALRLCDFDAEMEPGTTANQQLEYELAVLRAVPGVIAVASYPKSGFKPKELNANCVKLRLETEKKEERRKKGEKKEGEKRRERKRRREG